MQDPPINGCLLKRVEKQEIEAQAFGFYWENFYQLIEQIRSECIEIQEAWEINDRRHLQEEIGDLIHAVVSLAAYCKLDPSETLKQSIEKFQRRYDTVVQMVQKEGHDNLHKQPFDVLMSYWKRAKAQTKNEYKS